MDIKNLNITLKDYWDANYARWEFVKNIQKQAKQKPLKGLTDKIAKDKLKLPAGKYHTVAPINFYTLLREYVGVKRGFTRYDEIFGDLYLYTSYKAVQGKTIAGDVARTSKNMNLPLKDWNDGNIKFDKVFLNYDASNYKPPLNYITKSITSLAHHPLSNAHPYRAFNNCHYFFNCHEPKLTYRGVSDECKWALDYKQSINHKVIFMLVNLFNPKFNYTSTRMKLGSLYNFYLTLIPEERLQEKGINFSKGPMKRIYKYLKDMPAGFQAYSNKTYNNQYGKYLKPYVEAPSEKEVKSYIQDQHTKKQLQQIYLLLTTSIVTTAPFFNFKDPSDSTYFEEGFLKTAQTSLTEMLSKPKEELVQAIWDSIKCTDHLSNLYEGTSIEGIYNSLTRYLQEGSSEGLMLNTVTNLSLIMFTKVIWSISNLKQEIVKTGSLIPTLTELPYIQTFKKLGRLKTFSGLYNSLRVGSINNRSTHYHLSGSVIDGLLMRYNKNPFMFQKFRGKLKNSLKPLKEREEIIFSNYNYNTSRLTFEDFVNNRNKNFSNGKRVPLSPDTQKYLNLSSKIRKTNFITAYKTNYTLWFFDKSLYNIYYDLVQDIFKPSNFNSTRGLFRPIDKRSPHDK